MVETGLTKDGRTFVLVNEEIEAEMDDDKWWAENQNMIRLERRDGMILPYNVHREQEDENMNDGSDEEYTRRMSEVTLEKGDQAKITEGEVTTEGGNNTENATKKDEAPNFDEGVSMSRDPSSGLMSREESRDSDDGGVAL